MDIYPVICGPTATGKTALAVALAKLLAPAVLINADSRQTITGAVVGTFAPTATELQGVPCMLLAQHAPGVPFTVEQWLRSTVQAIHTIKAQGATPIVVGGTGLYIRALTKGWMFGGGTRHSAQRLEMESLWEEPVGRQALLDRYNLLSNAIQRNDERSNPRRVLRALERTQHTSEPHPSLVEWHNAAVPSLICSLTMERPALRWCITKRMEDIFATGALETEITELMHQGYLKDAIATCGIGYTEGMKLISGEISQKDAIARSVQRTMQYVKAQQTWFRHEQGSEYFNAGNATASLAETICWRLTVRHSGLKNLGKVHGPENYEIRTD